MRFEECKESLRGFFWCYRCLVEDFWCLVEILKVDMVYSDKEMVNFIGLVQIMVKDDEEMVELVSLVQIEWVIFDDFEIVMSELLKWEFEWEIFDDQVLMNELVQFIFYKLRFES